MLVYSLYFDLSVYLFPIFQKINQTLLLLIMLYFYPYLFIFFYNNILITIFLTLINLFTKILMTKLTNKHKYKRSNIFCICQTILLIIIYKEINISQLKECLICLQ